MNKVMSDEEVETLSRLIVAAPELLKALQDLAKWYDDGVSTYHPHCPIALAQIWEDARQAIVKATGKEV